jgi:hypothetical protein
MLKRFLRLVKIETSETITRFARDPLGGRIIGHSAPVVRYHFDAGRQCGSTKAVTKKSFPRLPGIMP